MLAIGHLFHATQQIVLDLFVDQRVLFVQRMIEHELSHPHGIGQRLTWAKQGNRKEQRSVTSTLSTLRNKTNISVQHLSRLHVDVLESIQVLINIGLQAEKMFLRESRGVSVRVRKT